MWLDWKQTELYPQVAKWAYPVLFGFQFGDAAEGRKATSERLEILAAHLKERAFVNGEKPSIADLAIYGLWGFFDAANFDLPPAIQAYRKRVHDQFADAIKEWDSHPQSQVNYCLSKRTPVYWTFPGSPNHITSFALISTLGVKAEVREVDIHKGGSHTPEYLALNPNGHIPTFRDSNGIVVWESNAILRYVALTYDKENKYYPADIKERSQVDRMLDWRQTELWSSFVPFPRHYFRGQKSDLAAAKKTVSEKLEILEQIIGGKKFAALDKPTLADLALTPLLAILPGFGVPTSDKIKAYVENVFTAFPVVREWAAGTTKHLSQLVKPE